MSFSTETKNELSRMDIGNRALDIAELSAIIRLSGSLHFMGNMQIGLKITTELNSIARRVFKILKKEFEINTSITVNKNQMLKKNNSYVLTITPEMGASKLLVALGILDNENTFITRNDISNKIVKEPEDAHAYIRGAFLGGGSINDPEKNYHMEFVANNEDYAYELSELINSMGFNSKIVARKNNFVVYLKESEQISDLLAIIGATNAMFALQNIKIMKEMRNNVNRIVNCETANLSKTVDAAVRQVENILIIQKTIGIRGLPENLQELAMLRLEYEDMSLKELGEMLHPPLGKSGVNHRFKKIEEIANRHRDEVSLEDLF
ncbi:DNA-binding protein WhiA [Peptostreptococcus porci]|uniref:DNA-binding protein WhiA n=1 Tax=Peptostreptococcus porci TaxID=2652282 RepID=UPI0023EF97CA|nr:DNA-binding protein WhiA [Peptostreptococcus porci]MDD7182323.1 DNA-binding protein WhiA [Peptostreptococcus porci]MDY4129225.1 DNA-binding protein WhiA [Peptostreptococcus porci]MDY5437376.1 DNA-binding protein WhiA [Peptostreptococcus porci]MDY5480108.1 DNA-binding protein WhiA [Peptostreptococcus porci]MDY5963996.1 DNA-binding protein WhiA [Peptostreptococcus porci]